MCKKTTFENTPILVPLMYDSLIKALFIKNQDILKSFLLATSSINKINSIDFIRNELTKDNINEKSKTTDILILVNDYFIVDLEFGLDSFEYYKERNINYAEKLNLRALEVGNNDKLPKYKVIQLNIYNYPKSIDLKDDVILNYGIKSKRCYRSNPKILVKNIAKYKELYYTGDRKRETVYLAFLASSTYEELESILRNEESEKSVDKIKKEVEKMTTNSLWVEKWDEKEDQQRVLNLVRKDSFKEGKSIGLEQGLAQKENDLIRGMFKNGLELSLISSITGNSIENLKEFQNNYMRS